MAGARGDLEMCLNSAGKVAAGGDLDDDGHPKRTGTVWTVSAHIITAVIGAGVLSLSWGMAQLGWLAGVATIVAFSVVTLFTSNLLADCYRSPDPLTGKRNHTYMDAVKTILGGRMHLVCGWIQYVILVGVVIGYTITTSASMVAISKSNCFHKKGPEASCEFSNTPYMAALGILELFLSQIPSFHKLSWLSGVAAIMSFGYAFIGIGLSLARIIAGEGGRTSITGVEIGVDVTESEKVWRIFRALGDIASASFFSIILFDIQDTLKSSPVPENKAMKRANAFATVTMTIIFLMCSCLGYGAFGNHAPENMLTGFGFYEPFWLVDLANIMIVVHLVGAYQIVAQPVFRVVERWANAKWSKSGYITKEYEAKIAHFGFSFNPFKLTWRTAFVAFTTLVSMVMPFFGAMFALIGAMGYWPLVVYFPVEMYIVQNKVRRLTPRWFGLHLLSLACLLVTLAALTGAIQGLSKGLQAAKPFQLKQ